MKIIFLGCTRFSERVLTALLKNGFKIEAIFTIPQIFRVRGKEEVVNSNFVDLQPLSDEYNIPIYYVNENKSIGSYLEIMESLKPDIILTIGWYYMIPEKVRNIAKFGACGIHASILPKYAGWAPLVWAMINGETKTGVTFFQFDESVDGGDIIAQKSFLIEDNETIKEVYEKATLKSIEILLENLPKLNTITFKSQDKSKIEVWDKRNPEDGEIDFTKDSKEIYNFIRAQSEPYPGAFLEQKMAKKLSLKKLELEISELELF